MDATAAAKKLLKKQERQKKKAKSLARKQTKQPDVPAQQQQQQHQQEQQPSKKFQKLQGAAKTTTTTTALPSQPEKQPVGFEYEGTEKFLTPAHPQFEELVASSYQGFVHDPAASIDVAFHRAARKTFEMLRDKSYFQYDVVMAGGKNLSRTFVRRTLVGDPGITYKYLGLRIFAHSWTGETAAPWFKRVRAMNDQLVGRTKRAMQRATNAMGSCDYNLTLINYMEPLSNWDLGLKDDETCGLGKTSVSWHADSSLQDFSAIAVYNCMMEDPNKKKVKKPNKKRNASQMDDHQNEDRDWRIALRMSPEVPAEKTTAGKKGALVGAGPRGAKPGRPAATATAPPQPPAVSMATKDGDTYYLLGDFNHDHQHMVLTGSTVRVSSTHRVAVDSDSTLASILARLHAAYDLTNVPTTEEDKDGVIRILTPQQVLKEQNALTEVEMEWIRQYWLQGKEHDVLHVDWQKPMRELEQIHWRRLETRTKQVLDMVLQEKEEEKWKLSDRSKVLNVLLQELTLRQKRRGQFKQRMQDKAYRRIAPAFQPVERPRFHDESPLPYDLAPQIEALEALKRKLKTK